MAMSMSLETLRRTEMIELFDIQDDFGHSYTACRLTPKWIDWLLANQERFRMRTDDPGEPPEPKGDDDEDIPF
jgi:hypothetical protein